MTLRIGINPIGWANDDLPELGGDTPLETILRETKLAGYDGTELGNKFPADPGALKAVLAAHGLACVSGWYSGELLVRDVAAELVCCRPHLDKLKAQGSTVIVWAETSNSIQGQIDTPLSARPMLSASEWEGYGARLTEMAELLLEEGVRMVYHHHMGAVCQSEADIHALMASTGPAVSLLLDTGHATWGGADPAALAARYRDRIAHVHAKDLRPAIRARADAEDWSFLRSVLEGVYTVPGDGGIDFAAVFRALPGYAGWVVVEAEQDPAQAPPLEYARKGRAHLLQTLRQAGLIGDSP